MFPQILVDSNVILDIFTNDANWSEWSGNILEKYCLSHELCINAIIYSEISLGFNLIEELDVEIEKAKFSFMPIPRAALFLAAKAFLQYRRSQGTKMTTLPDFFIGAHASILSIPLITRDPNRMKFYFPKLQIITPTNMVNLEEL